MDITKDFLITQLKDVTQDAKEEGWNEAIIFMLKWLNKTTNDAQEIKFTSWEPTHTEVDEARELISACILSQLPPKETIEKVSYEMARQQLRYWAQGLKLQAVKTLKDYYTLSLKQAKDAVDACWAQWA